MSKTHMEHICHIGLLIWFNGFLLGGGEKKCRIVLVPPEDKTSNARWSHLFWFASLLVQWWTLWMPMCRSLSAPLLSFPTRVSPPHLLLLCAVAHTCSSPFLLVGGLVGVGGVEWRSWFVKAERGNEEGEGEASCERVEKRCEEEEEE